MPITGTSGPDVLIGGPGNDLIQGLEGDDVLAGSNGIDTTDGGPGNDIHYVQEEYDVVVEREGEGSNDIVIVLRYQYGLTAGAYVETLTTLPWRDGGAWNLGGNELPNSIYGNEGNNSLSGAEGNDYLVGLEGNDWLYGGVGDDHMWGGPGDDNYGGVDSQFDLVIELPGEGIDAIYARECDYYRLAAGMEVEYLVGDSLSLMTLVGNEFDNVLYGRYGPFAFYGEGGVDTLKGWEFGDKYYVSDSRTIIVDELGPSDFYLQPEPNGRAAMFAQSSGATLPYMDVVYSSVDYALGAGAAIELLSTYWMYGFEPINLTGNELDNRLLGNNAGNILDAKGGWNILQGLGGSDVFTFSSVDFAAGDQSHIIDFEQGSDKIHLDGALFGLPAGALSAETFALGTQAGDADDRIIYDAQAGILYFDPDGNGPSAQAPFARFDLPLEMQSIGDLFVPPNLQTSDFLII